jgi:hypothetical protein
LKNQYYKKLYKHANGRSRDVSPKQWRPHFKW